MSITDPTKFQNTTDVSFVILKMHTFTSFTTIAGLLAATLASASDCNCIHGDQTARWIDKDNRAPGDALKTLWTPNGTVEIGAETQGQMAVLTSDANDELRTCFSDYVTGQQSQQDGAWSLWAGIVCTEGSSTVKMGTNNNTGTNSSSAAGNQSS